MVYIKNHAVPPTLLEWQHERIAAGMSEETARLFARRISALAYGLNVPPEELPDDAVARYGMGRDLSHYTVASYTNALNAWKLYQRNGARTPPPQNAGVIGAVKSWGMEYPEMVEWVTVLDSDGKARSTISAYTGDMRAVCRFTGKRPAELTTTDVRNFIAAKNIVSRERTGRPLSGKYRVRLISSLKSFCEATGRPDFTAPIKRPRKDAVHYNPVSRDEVTYMLQSARAQYATRDSSYADFGRRMYTMTRLCSSMGLRVTEAARTRPDMLKAIDGVPHLSARGPVVKGPDESSWVSLPCSNSVYEDLTANYQPDETILPASWPPQSISGAYANWCRSIGLMDVTAHRLRAYYATQLYYRSSHNIILVQRRLRHRQLETTAGYIALLDTAEERELVTTFDDDLILEPTTAEIAEGGPLLAMAGSADWSNVVQLFAANRR
ncbi:tyrosine-type recombinase/integrase [Streptomyces sp. NPDC102340]|uniref:tyrosine-type recombinase/integrase n=1 Tax=unclassified Streptomyces TaxID=2593676 RepID=UPI00380E5C26